MRILVSGSTGLVGSALVERLSQSGHEVVRMVRPGRTTDTRGGELNGTKQVSWSPQTGDLAAAANEADAIVHLAGVSIADGRWNPERKRALRDSRVAATQRLVESLRGLPHPPRIFIAASAIGYYGNRGDEELTESSAPGTDFLARLCQDWETESSRATEFGARVAQLRFGVILAKKGGALPKMTLPFKLGAGGPVGSGRQWMSWVALDDIVEILVRALTDDAMTGVFNAVSPNPVRNADFGKALGKELHRPAILPTPGFALRLALGEMADALLLSSQRVLPKRLEEIGYRFALPELPTALAAILGARVPGARAVGAQGSS